jgi:hypothetical protein
LLIKGKKKKKKRKNSAGVFPKPSLPEKLTVNMSLCMPERHMGSGGTLLLILNPGTTWE